MIKYRHPGRLESIRYRSSKNKKSILAIILRHLFDLTADIKHQNCQIILPVITLDFLGTAQPKDLCTAIFHFLYLASLSVK